MNPLIPFQHMYVVFPGVVSVVPAPDQRACNMFRPVEVEVGFWERVLRWWVGETERENLETVEWFEKECSEAAVCGMFEDEDEKEVINVLLKRNERVKAVPRFAVHVAMALRAKLGLSAMNRNTPGNVGLVRSRICAELKRYNVRDKDRAAHLQLIENVFFEDSTYHHVSDTRKRLASESKFCKWLMGGRERPQAMQF